MLRDMMQRLGIVFGCVDLIVDRQGDIYFLEVNQAGAFLFVEDSLLELPIFRAMAAMLSASRTDYSINDCVDVRFSSYSESDEYREMNTIYLQAESLESRIIPFFPPLPSITRPNRLALVRP